MDTNFIGKPTNFRCVEEGKEPNFRHTFDLNGTQNDETLRLYLRSAGLSDEIECLTAEQRRAFIYDIIRSNKLPGYWMPSTLKNSNKIMQRPSIRPPPPPQTPPISKSATPSPYAERKNDSSSSSLSYATMRSTASSSSLQSLEHISPKPQRGLPPPTTPPSASSFLTSSKGNHYEISGPMNFQHTAGDMARDRTRNAFDLSASSNDNVLRKYMMERGISEEDIAGMRKADIIRKIVQSKFTWMPKKKDHTTAIEHQLVYANVHQNNDTISIRSTPSYEELSLASQPASPSPSLTSTNSNTEIQSKQKTDFSNYTLITSRFADISQFPAPGELFENCSYEGYATVPKTVALPPLSPNAIRPAPPPRKSQQQTPKEYTFKSNIPPPPSTVRAQTQENDTIWKTRNSTDYDNAFETIPIQRINNHGSQQLNMLPNTLRQLTEPLYVTTPSKQTRQTATVEQKPGTAARGAFIPPPPPLPPLTISSTAHHEASTLPVSQNCIENGPRTTPTTNEMTITPISKQIQKSAFVRPPPPPTPPRPMTEFGVLPPPPPPTIATQPKPNQTALAPVGEDDRDALLESIRKGVALKKVNQKAATISGVKPRAERKPPVMDFLTELKLGISLRRIKNPADNPFAADEPDESQA